MKYTEIMTSKVVLSKIGKQYGYINEPFILRPIFKNFLDKYYPSHMNTDRARNLVDVFIVLFNESKIHDDFYTNKSEYDGYFFVEQYKILTEYCIGRKTFENSIKFLKEMGLLDYENKWDTKRQIRRRWLRLNDKGITSLIERAKKMKKKLDEDKQNRIIKDNNW